MLVVRNHPFTEGKREGTNFQIFVKKGRFSKFFCIEGGVNQKIEGGLLKKDILCFSLLTC